VARALKPRPWPGDAGAAASITFDVDAECGFLAEGDEYRRRLTTLSEARFGVVRGLPRILAELAEFEAPATFYVPGDTAERHADAVAAILPDGHEVGHHGHRHLRSDRIDADAQRVELDEGLAALERVLGVRPAGYRSPSWQLTPETLGLLGEFGFSFDSSCMGDDRPYVEEHGDASILELPVHWSLDDWPNFFWSEDGGGNLAAPAAVLEAWSLELDRAVADRRHVTFTMHPEVIGRGYRIGVLRGLLEAIRDRDLWLATHAEVAAHLGSG
jgi:peptidoglycan/xylan/chitin deacetylase (PgdA/CDA1 family)